MAARRWLGLLWAVAAALAIGAPRAFGEEPEPEPALTAPLPSPSPFAHLQTLLPPLHDVDGIADPVPAASNVSFIDPASPWNIVRLRFEAAYDSNRPTRAEYQIAASGKRQRGFPIPEGRIDYQDLSSYVECAILPQLSVFFEAPMRWVNPEFNPDQSGIGDLHTGFKLAGIQRPDFTGSFQLLASIPTGTPQQGLGTGYASIEPDLLFNWRATDEFIVEGMVGVWLPIDDSTYGSEIMRYGLGFSYVEQPFDDFWIAPVIEGTGWTAIRGHQQIVFSPTKAVKTSTVANTIVNVDLGVRAGLGDFADVYAGYSRPFTGDVWYKDLWRIELRWRY
jgi:hypothetical protein